MLFCNRRDNIAGVLSASLYVAAITLVFSPCSFAVSLAKRTADDGSVPALKEYRFSDALYGELLPSGAVYDIQSDDPSQIKIKLSDLMMPTKSLVPDFSREKSFTLGELRRILGLTLPGELYDEAKVVAHFTFHDAIATEFTDATSKLKAKNVLPDNKDYYCLLKVIDAKTLIDITFQDNDALKEFLRNPPVASQPSVDGLKCHLTLPDFISVAYSLRRVSATESDLTGGVKGIADRDDAKQALNNPFPAYAPSERVDGAEGFLGIPKAKTYKDVFQNINKRLPKGLSCDVQQVAGGGYALVTEPLETIDPNDDKALSGENRFKPFPASVSGTSYWRSFAFILATDSFSVSNGDIKSLKTFLPSRVSLSVKGLNDNLPPNTRAYIFVYVFDNTSRKMVKGDALATKHLVAAGFFSQKDIDNATFQ